MIFERDFKELTEEDAALLDAYFDGYDYQASSHTLIANYIWRDTHKITWQVIGDYLCVAGLGTLETEEEEYFMSFPLTRTGTYEKDKLRETIDTAKKIFESKGKRFEISLIPASLAPLLKEIYGSQVELTHDRDDDDYIYLREDLVNLSGRKLHQKKNHLNYFRRTYDYTYEEITPETAREVLDFLERINHQKLLEMPEEWKTILELETRAIEELLSLLHTGRLLSGVIRIDGQIEAVTIGEFARTNSHESVLVHVEKANPAFRGIYQAINHDFCCHLPEDVVYVNREEDMGMENLRQTKLSYKPVKLAEKYEAAFVK
ncbi:MAG: phosphatidylglycerol lysyltransferase domain-containing protein [Firmicutes bacterium]|nr:phosphatidylglycerol lysyltransferase domain-containing protein [Bacillota bacterium]MDY3238682.1 phosphatidylglycerol lysyltransferase domain-containing protein [Anaerovoracaceae bacterium]